MQLVYSYRGGSYSVAFRSGGGIGCGGESSSVDNFRKLW